MKKRVSVLMILSLLLTCVGVTAMSDQTQGRIEDFAGFPQESAERFYYLREYPYTALGVITVAVGAIIYYNRAHVKRKVGQLLQLFQEQETEKTP